MVLWSSVGLAWCVTQRQRLSRKGGALPSVSCGTSQKKTQAAARARASGAGALLCCLKMADDAAPEPEPEAESGTPARLPEPDKAGYEAKVQSIKDDIDAKQGRMVSCALPAPSPRPGCALTVLGVLCSLGGAARHQGPDRHRPRQAQPAERGPGAPPLQFAQQLRSLGCLSANRGAELLTWKHLCCRAARAVSSSASARSARPRSTRRKGSASR